MVVVLHAHPIHGELHIQRNTNGEVTTASVMLKITAKATILERHIFQV